MTKYEEGMSALTCGKRHAKAGEKIIEKAEQKYGLPKAIANDNEKK